MNTDVMLASRTVLVYSTVGQAKKQVESSARTWGALRSELVNHDVSTSGMKAVIGQTQVSLDLDDAQLPESNFTLFLVPAKVESGFWDDENSDDDDDDDNFEDDENLSKEEIIEALEEAEDELDNAKEAVGKALTYLRGEKPLDPETKKLQEEAELIKKKFSGRG